MTPGPANHDSRAEIGDAQDRITIAERFDRIEKHLKDHDTQIASLKTLGSLRQVKQELLPPRAMRDETVPQIRSQEPAPVTEGTRKAPTWNRGAYLLYRSLFTVLGFVMALLAYLITPEELPYRAFILVVIVVSIVNLVLAFLKKPAKTVVRQTERGQRVSDTTQDNITTRPPDRETAMRRSMKQQSGGEEDNR